MKFSFAGFFKSIKDDIAWFSAKYKKMSPGERVKHLFLGLSIRIKISLIMIVLLAVTILTISNVLFHSQKQILLDEMRQRGAVLSKNLANSGLQSILNKDQLSRSDAIITLMKGKEVLYGLIVDKNGKILESSNPSQIGTKASEGYSFQLEKLRETASFSIVWNGRSVLDFINPIMIKSGGKQAFLVMSGSDWIGVLWRGKS